MALIKQHTHQKDGTGTEKAHELQPQFPSLAPSCYKSCDDPPLLTPPAAPCKSQVEKTAEDSHQMKERFGTGLNTVQD